VGVVSKLELVSDTEPPKQTVGRYELIKRLARGGMAELFIAKATGIEGFEKVVALKRILPHLVDDEDFVRMFLTEARLAATLDHPNIVHVHDIGKDDGEYFFTMEYVHGEDVRRILNKLNEEEQKMPVRHALTIISGIAGGLHHAHEQIGFDGKPLGIVHRDVSPSNIIVTNSGAVKLLDFGIAKAGARTAVSGLGSFKGKAAYMSPEQCRGEIVDRRSDVFALGIVLQELLTMQPAYPNPDALVVISKVAKGEFTPIEEVWPDCPQGLEDILHRALQLDAKDRYQTAQELQLDLEKYAHENNIPLSMASLGQYMSEHFGQKPYPWATEDNKEAKKDVTDIDDILDLDPDEEFGTTEVVDEAEEVPPPPDKPTVVAPAPTSPEPIPATQKAPAIDPSGSNPRLQSPNSGSYPSNPDAPILVGGTQKSPAVPMPPRSKIKPPRNTGSFREVTQSVSPGGWVVVAAILLGGLLAAWAISRPDDEPAKAKETAPPKLIESSPIEPDPTELAPREPIRPAAAAPVQHARPKPEAPTPSPAPAAEPKPSPAPKPVPAEKKPQAVDAAPKGTTRDAEPSPKPRRPPPPPEPAPDKPKPRPNQRPDPNGLEPF
jgi:serine/threonine protein kinase